MDPHLKHFSIALKKRDGGGSNVNMSDACMPKSNPFNMVVTNFFVKLLLFFSIFQIIYNTLSLNLNFLMLNKF